MDSKLARFCEGLMEAGWITAVIAIPLFFNIHSDRVFEPDKLTLLRSIALLMSIAWVTKFIELRGWERLQWARWRDEKSIWRMPFILPVVLLVLVYLISTAISVTPRVSWAGSYQRLQGTYTTLSYIVIFAIAVSTIRSKAQVSRVITAIIITSIPVSFYGLLQHFDLDPLPWGGDTAKRIAGHMGNAIFIAAYLIMVVPLTLARIFDAFTSILADEELSFADVVRSSVYIFTLAIQLIAIYWSFSRGPWIGLAGALYAFILIVLVTLRNADAKQERPGLVDVVKGVLFVFVGLPLLFLGAFAITQLTPALSGSTATFASFISSVFLLILILFVMVAIQRGWRWLWFSWLLLALVVAVWLGTFNFTQQLEEQFAETAVLGELTDTYAEWQKIPGVGRLGKLLRSEGGTGRVRVLIWSGALELIQPHEPLKYPDGREDPFNFLRPFFGYGPESMYVAYNRFYPPELATVEARNASPDRSHNETFDALVITGGIGFLVWQILYLSVFYYGFSWLGVIKSKLDRNLLIGFWILGAVGFGILISSIFGPPFLGVAIPFGSIVGLVVYLVYYALFTRSSEEDRAVDPFNATRLLMIALVTAVLAHYVEIHFGIAIAATRVHFFVYLALMFIVGHLLPQITQAKEKAVVVAEAVATTNAPSKRVRKSRRNRQAPSTTVEKSATGYWPPILLAALMLGLAIGLLGFEFITYVVPPDKQITSANDITAVEIFYQSFFVNTRKDFAASPFIFVMMMMTWILGTFLYMSEMVKSREISLATYVSGELASSKRQVSAILFGGMLVLSVLARFLWLPSGSEATTTTVLSGALLLGWAVCCLIAVILLVLDVEGGDLVAGFMAMFALLLSLAVLVSGGILYALVLGGTCLVILTQLWRPNWSRFVLPFGVMGGVSLSVGLFFAFVQASWFRSSLFTPNVPPGTDPIQVRVLEASQVAGFLTLVYTFVIVLLILSGFIVAFGYRSSRRRRESSGTAVAFATLAVLLGIGFFAISHSNMRFIQADMIYKRGKPFDQQGGRQRDPQLWDAAVAIYEEAIDIVPEEDFYYLFLGRAYLERATITEQLADQVAILDKAEERLIEAQEINPLNTDHTANLARLNTRWTQLVQTEEERQARTDTAIEYYLGALSLSPQNSVIRNEYARLLLDLRGDCEESLAVYEESLEIDPYYEQTYFAYADANINCANNSDFADSEEDRDRLYRVAAQSYEDGLLLDDRNVQVWLRLAQIYQELDEPENAIPAYEQVKVKDTRDRFPDWNIDYLIAQSYQALGDTDAALQTAEVALAAAPDEAKAQVRQLINQLNGGEAEETSSAAEDELVPTVNLTELATERPLAELEPRERNGFYSELPPTVIDTSKAYHAIITTNKGEMRFRLFDNRTPLTVNNFAYLASQGYYDDTIFHRVLENFMAQAGDPTGTGTGGPGYQFEDEIDTRNSFDKRGVLAMANAGPDTNGSQFFITFEPTPWLDGNHTIFGQLLEGDDVLSAITLRDPSDPDAPADVILRIDVVEVN